MMRGLAAALLVTLLVPLSRAKADEIDCTRAHWSEGRPAVNIGHIFCGELRRRPDGYHSEAIASTPLVRGVIGRQPLGRGLYNGTVIFADGERKFSTFYPRACTIDQIVASIRYAVSQPPVPKPGGWGYLGPSAPTNASPANASPANTSDGREFCLGDDGLPFTIRYARLSRGDINTAFPDAGRGGPR